MSGTGLDIRPARQTDAAACAAILNAWIDETDWMPRIHPADDVVRHYRETVLPKRKVFVAESPITGYIALDESEGEITSLFVADKGRGVGAALVDTAKGLCDQLSLWTFEANTGAQRFYRREGFQAVERSDGDNEEGLPDIRFEWRRV